MEQNILTECENFDDFPHKYLYVDKSSNYYYIKNDQNAFITRKYVDSISRDNNDDIITLFGYYNIFNGELVLKMQEKITLFGVLKNNEDKILPLYRILSQNDDSEFYLTYDDIMELQSYQNKKFKAYKAYKKSLFNSNKVK